MAFGLQDKALLYAGPTNAYGASMIPTVTVKSQVTPDIVYDPNADKKKSPLVKAIMKFLKPAVYVDSAVGKYQQEPHGKPTKNYGPALIVGTFSGLIALGFLAGRLTSRKKR